MLPAVLRVVVRRSQAVPHSSCVSMAWHGHADTDGVAWLLKQVFGLHKAARFQAR